MELAFFNSKSVNIEYSRTRSLGDGALMLAKHRIAFSGNRWYTFRQWTEPSNDDGVLVPAEPLVQVIKDGFLLEWNQHHKQAFADSFAEGRNIYADWYYTLYCSLNAPKRILQSNGHADLEDKLKKKYPDYCDHPFLPDAVQTHLGDYILRSTSESVDGAKCWLIEWPGVDRIWTDPNCGFAIRRRAHTWGVDKPLRAEIWNRQLKEVKSGLWLPYSQEVELYAHLAEPKAKWGKVQSRSSYSVQSIEFDTLTPEFFDIELPPGTYVFDLPRKFKYVVADSATDPLIAPIQQAQQIRQRRTMIQTGVAVGVACVLVVAAIIVRRRYFARA
jgi:hypothetical protein